MPNRHTSYMEEMKGNRQASCNQQCGDVLHKLMWKESLPFLATAAAFSSLTLSVRIPASALSRSRICCTSEVEVASFRIALRSSLNFVSFSYGKTYLLASVFASSSKSFAVFGSKVLRSISASASGFASPPNRSFAAFRSESSCSLQHQKGFKV